MKAEQQAAYRIETWHKGEINTRLVNGAIDTQHAGYFLDKDVAENYCTPIFNSKSYASVEKVDVLIDEKTGKVRLLGDEISLHKIHQKIKAKAKAKEQLDPETYKALFI